VLVARLLTLNRIHSRLGQRTLNLPFVRRVLVRIVQIIVQGLLVDSQLLRWQGYLHLL